MHRLTDLHLNRFVKALALASTMILAGCDAVVDCLDNDGPVFNTSVLEPATLNQVYSQTISASVDNEPNDGRFIYEITQISGTLPPGITAEQRGRAYVFSGTPTALGTFNVEINIEIDDGLDAAESGLCYRNRSRSFALFVVQDNS